MQYLHSYALPKASLLFLVERNFMRPAHAASSYQIMYVRLYVIHLLRLVPPNRAGVLSLKMKCDRQ